MNQVKLPFGEPNDLQRRVIDSFRNGHRLVLMVSGRQGGKSHFGARWLLAQTMQNNVKHKLAFAVAPTFRMARVLQRKLEEVLKADKRLWDRIKHTKQPIPTYEFPNGWIIEVHSSDDPDALRGPSVSAVWYDEVAKGSEESFDILMPTLLSTGGRFLGTTTPRGKQNWIFRRLYLKSVPPGEPDHDPDLYNQAYDTVVGSTWENVDNLSEEAIKQLEDQYGKDSAFGRQEISGEFVSYEGLVFKWDEGNFIPHKDLPDLDQYSLLVGGIDFGFVDPAVAVVMGYRDGNWFAIDGVYESGLTLNEFADQIAILEAQYRVPVWYADSSRPDSIAELAARGIGARAAIKPKIEDRVREMAMFTDNNRFKVSYRCPFVRDELQLYQYPEESKLFRDKERKPIDAHNHAMDAIGYALWSERWVWRNDVRFRFTQTDEGDDPDDERIFLRERTKSRTPTPRGPSGLYGN